MIQVRELCKSFGDVRAVDRVSLEIAQGGVVGLLGHNGAGKTTMMRMITGFLEPSSGTVTVGGTDVLADRLGVQRLIGYLPEDAPLYPEMLVQEYLLMMAELRGIPAGERRRAVVDAVNATGLEQHVLRPIGHLSKGYRQRVGLAQAIVHRPKVLILDEPTNGLDPVQIQAIRKLVRDFAQTSTVILSTHILQEVEAVCDRVLVLMGGRLVADGPIDELLESKVVRLSVAEGAADVAGTLKKVAGVIGADRRGPDEHLSGYEVWAVHYEGDTPPTPGVIRAGIGAGWSIASAGPERLTLQAVFGRLQDELAQQHTEVAS